MYKVLIVDDEPSIQSMLFDFLESDYDVTACSNAGEALNYVNNDTFDLVISDINMPGMKGYELLSKVKSISPNTRTALITAYNVDEYLSLARDHNIFNIISKTTPFNFDELGSLVHSLTSGDIFGIEKHLGSAYKKLGSFQITASSEAKIVRNSLIDLLPTLPRDPSEIKLVLDEIITNAIYHSPQNDSGEKLYEEYHNISLKENETIHITVGSDTEKICISILDNQGNLDKERVLYLLDRHINAKGIFDESGRGIYMSRLFSDRIIININPKVKTEIIIIFYLEPDAFKGYKPLYVNQL